MNKIELIEKIEKIEKSVKKTVSEMISKNNNNLASAIAEIISTGQKNAVVISKIINKHCNNSNEVSNIINIDIESTPTNPKLPSDKTNY